MSADEYRREQAAGFPSIKRIDAVPEKCSEDVVQACFILRLRADGYRQPHELDRGHIAHGLYMVNSQRRPSKVTFGIPDVMVKPKGCPWWVGVELKARPMARAKVQPGQQEIVDSQCGIITDDPDGAMAWLRSLEK